MLKKFKYYTLVLLAVLFVFASCLNKKNDNDFDVSQYTPEREAELLKEYIDALVANGKDVDTTDTGLMVFDFEAGDGDFVSLGDSIGIKYDGYVLGSTSPFSSSVGNGDGIYRFRQVEGIHIEGFYEAIFQLNTGAEGFYILPSNIAFGEVGAGDAFGNYVVPPYTPVLFRIELVEIYEKASEI